MSPIDKPYLDPAGLTGVTRRAFLKYTGVLSAAAAVSATLAACGGPASTNSVASQTSAATSGTAPAGSSRAPSAAATPQGTIEATLAFQLSSGFDPMNASSAVALVGNMHMLEALVEIDLVTRQPYLALAKTQPTASADGLTWSVVLRDGAKFSDGSPVTADDVAWSFTRILDPANKALMATFVPFLDSVTAKDASTAEFKLKYPFRLFPTRIACIKIVPKAKTADAAASKTFDTAPIGSGPFTLVSADATSGIKLAANAKYNGPRPPLVTAITLNTTPDSSARVSDLQGGRSQAIEAVPYLNVASLQGKFQVDEKQSFNHLFLMFNCKAAPFSDKRVRQALHYALDTDKIIKVALQGFGTAATSYLSTDNAGYQKAATVYGFDQAKAKSLLKEAGAENLSFELVTTNTAFVTDSAPLMISMWKDIGVTVTLNTAPSSAVYGQMVPDAKFRALAASGDPTVWGPNDVDMLLRWFYYGTTWPVDRFRWDAATAKQCADLIDTAAKAKDDATQKATWKQVLDLLAVQVPLYPVYHTKTVTGSDATKLNNFKGLNTTGLEFLGVSRKG
ncbi:MAG: ABC transporter substrate-binding protein [Actinomycetota bacterium]|nr:ABC transporter substrate-binding protein [Actinomycetota bacterium]